VSTPSSLQDGPHIAQKFKMTALLVRIVLPLALGYFLSYFFRTINSVLATRLSADLSLDASTLGLVTSAYFLAAMAAQLPIGIALDRIGPRFVQAVSLSLAAVGAWLFSIAEDVQALFVARMLIGLGVATALMAGLKAIAMWAPLERLALLNGVFVAMGATGAIVASKPIEALLSLITWRQMFVGIGGVAIIVALLILICVPRLAPRSGGAGLREKPPGLSQIYRDARFWRLAPLSSLMIGGAWALQGLWAAPWFADVAGLEQSQIASHLMLMAFALCIGALGFGILADQLRRKGIGPDALLMIAAVAYITAEVALALRWRISPIVPWSIVGIIAAATTLSFTICANTFGKESVGRANCALNVLHFGSAFATQWIFGVLISLWPRDELGHYPAAAFSTAFLLLACLQLPALYWFVRPQWRVRRAAAEPQASA